jgi:hypothetical protein
MFPNSVTPPSRDGVSPATANRARLDGRTDEQATPGCGNTPFYMSPTNWRHRAQLLNPADNGASGLQTEAPASDD